MTESFQLLRKFHQHVFKKSLSLKRDTQVQKLD